MYLDYKTGKKHVKSVARAIHRAKGTPQLPVQTNLARTTQQSQYGGTSITASRAPVTAISQRNGEEAARQANSLPTQSWIPPAPPLDGQRADTANTIEDESRDGRETSSGRSLELPAPALESVERKGGDVTIMATSTDAYEVGPQHGPHRSSREDGDRPLLRRIFTLSTPLMPAKSKPDIDMVAMDQVRTRQREFHLFMTNEVNKVESFYKEKEDAAGHRLKVLREQLHEMNDQRVQQEVHLQHQRDLRVQEAGSDGWKSRSSSTHHLSSLIRPIDEMVDHAKISIRGPPRSRKASASEPDTNDRGDYARRPQTHEIPYRTAKRSLKLASLEFYRSMELLKSYALLNRTAFVKINKKYDKATDAQPPMRYMAELVDKASFVRSDVLDGHMHAIEELFAKYFEKGNRKVATGKLRASIGRMEDQSGISFWNGLMVGVGAIFTVHGILYANRLLDTDDAIVRAQTVFLMQIYGGYLLALYLFGWFCFSCRTWTMNKINYTFIFEFDARHALDWRELAAFPSFFLLLFGLSTWLNFSRYTIPVLFLYYPVILIGLTCVVIFLPFRVLFYRSRKWLAFAHVSISSACRFVYQHHRVDYYLPASSPSNSETSSSATCTAPWYMSSRYVWPCISTLH